MAVKYPLAPENFQDDCDTVKIKPEKALMKALEECFRVNADESEKRLPMLPKILKLATDFKKSKEVVAAGPKAIKVVGDLIDYIPTERKNIEERVRSLQETGACEVGVIFKITDWNGKPFAGAKAYATFESPRVPTINANGTVGSAGFKIDKVKLRPTGMVNLSITAGSQDIEGVAPYTFKPSPKLVLQFEAEQQFQNYKTKAKSIDEVKKKYGWKGSVGVEFKVVTVGGEKTSESEYTEARENEVEWELKAGLPSFKPFRQIP